MAQGGRGVGAMNASEDPFCEAALWQKPDMAIYQPFGAVTGFAMLVIALVNNIKWQNNTMNSGEGMPFMLLMCKASLVLVGIGTTLYHATEKNTLQKAHLNHGLADWLPITIMTMNILTLYLFRMLHHHSTQNRDSRPNLVMTEKRETGVFVLVLLWTFVLVMGIDSETNAYFVSRDSAYGAILNAVLLVPLALVLTYAMRYHMQWHDSRWLVASLGVSAGLWLLNNYLCERAPWLSLLHGIYHVTIAYAFVYAACLGVCIKSHKWQFALSPYAWPQIVQVRMQITHTDDEDDPSVLFF